MSRTPLSEEEHRLRGSRPTRAKPEEPSQVLTGRPKRPSYLSPEARKEWNRIVPMLAERGTLSRADSAVLEIYCETKSRWVAAQREIQEQGLMVTTTTLDRNGAAVTSRKINSVVRVAAECERSLRTFLIQFGMTPQSREKVKPTKKSEEEEELPPNSIGRQFPEAFK
jgi:P27 family predicted phage terminase small subunit